MNTFITTQAWNQASKYFFKHFRVRVRVRVETVNYKIEFFWIERIMLVLRAARLLLLGNLLVFNFRKLRIALLWPKIDLFLTTTGQNSSFIEFYQDFLDPSFRKLEISTLFDVKLATNDIRNMSFDANNQKRKIFLSFCSRA